MRWEGHYVWLTHRRSLTAAIDELHPNSIPTGLTCLVANQEALGGTCGDRKRARVAHWVKAFLEQ